MATQTIKTTIKLRYDTLANWTSVNPVLAAGEVAVVAIPTDSASTVQQVTKPANLFKVGDGSTEFNLLPYTSALAADVYGWAKAATKPSYTKSEVGLGNVLNVASYAKTETYSKTEVNNLIKEIEDDLAVVDTNTQFQLVNTGTTIKLQKHEKGSSTWTDVNSYDLTTILAGTFDAKGAASTALSNAKSYADGLIADEVERADGKYELAGAETRAKNYAKSYADGLAVNYDSKGSADQALEDAKAYTDGKVDGKFDSKGSAAQALVDAKSYVDGKVDGKFDAVGSADQALEDAKDYTDTEVKKVSDVVTTIGNTVTNMGTGAVVVGKAVKDQKGNVIDTTYATKQELQTLNGNVYNKTEVDGLIDGVNDIIEALTNGTSTEEIDSVMELVAYVNEHGVEVKGMKDDISENAGNISTLQGEVNTIKDKPAYNITSTNIADWNDAVTKEHTHKNKDLLDTYTQTEANLADAVARKHTHNNKSALDGITDAKVTSWDGEVGAKALAETKENAGVAASLIGALDVTVTGMGAGKTIKTLTETDGKIAATFQDISIKKLQISDFKDSDYDAAGSASSALASAKSYADGLAKNYDASGSAAKALVDAKAYADAEDAKIESRVTTLEGKAGLDKVGTVTKVSAGTGLKVTGTATTTPTVEIDTDVIFVLDGGSAAGH